MFLNYLYAKKRFQPDFFLYENNKSASQAIKEQISKELSVELMYINSALVSAQNRQRFYAFNWSVEQPQDRGILLRDILETTVFEKGYNLAPPIPINETNGKSYAIKAQYGKSSPTSFVSGNHFPATAVAQPIRIGTIENDAQNKQHDSKQYRVYSTDGKSTTLCGQGGGIGAKTGLYAIPINTTADGKAQCLRATCYKDGIRNMIANNVDKRTCVAIPDCKLCEYCAMLDAPIYKVDGGYITVGANRYPIQLKDGCYIIRKLTVTECCRLQTLPDNYCKAVSNSQAYKGLGNGWTAEVIIHILNGALANVDRNEKIVVLSMYDGIGTGRYCLDKMGFKNVEYYAFEIDKFAMKIANDNYPDIIQCGDAFQMRDNDFTLNGLLAQQHIFLNKEFNL